MADVTEDIDIMRRMGLGSASDDRGEFDLHLHGETPGAWRVSQTGSSADAVWLPKSQVDSLDGRPMVGRASKFLVPEWLADKKGLEY